MSIVDKKGIFATITGALGGSAIASSVGGTILSVGPVAIVGATPIGWVLGGAALAGGAGYLTYKTIFFSGESHGEVNYAKRDYIKDKKDKINIIKTKIDGRVISISLNLLNKLPNTFSSESKEKIKEGIQKGVVSPFQIIDFCNKQLPEEEKIIFDGSFTSIDIFIAIRLGLLFGAIDNKIVKTEIDSLKNGVINYFNLKELLEEDEINEIFDNVLGAKDDLKRLEESTAEELHYQLYLAYSQIKDKRLKEMLLDYLSIIINADNNINDKEKALFRVFYNLYISEYFSDKYINCLENMVDPINKNLYSKFSTDSGEEEEFKSKKEEVTLSFVKELSHKDIYSIYSADLFGRTKKGFVLTPLGIITNIAKCRNEPIKIIAYSMIKDLLKTDNKLSLICDFYSSGSKVEFAYKNNQKDPFIKFLNDIVIINNENKMT